MALIAPTIKTDSAQVTGRFSSHYTWTMASTDTMTPLAVDVRTDRIAIQITPVGTGTGNVQGALSQATPAAGDWVNWSGGSVSAVTQGPYSATRVVPKWIQALCTAGNIRVDVWLWG